MQVVRQEMQDISDRIIAGVSGERREKEKWLDLGIRMLS